MAKRDERYYVADEGFEDLINELNAMNYKGEKAVTRALRAGGKVFADLAKAGVNYSNRNSDKHLRDSIGVSYVKIGDAGEKYVSVGTYLGNGNYRNKVYWGHIVEGGHWIVNKGVVRGWVSARPFMQPAFERGKDKAHEEITKIVYKALGL